VRFVRSVFALVLLAAWPAVTSHALLERFGIIHQVHNDHDLDHHHHFDRPSHEHDRQHEHEHNSGNHDFAHGDYLARLGNDDAPLGLDLPIYEITSVAILCQCPVHCRDISPLGPAPPGVAPPEYLHVWNFLHRTALDARAPSSLS
jgi:hypothetical protein